MRRAYCLLDVFTETPLAGNPLAVVLDADGLDDARMQAIAREFNLPETVFVFAPRDPVNTAALRIFTPARELPFAGHPTVGAAALVAHLRAPQMLAAQDLRAGAGGTGRRRRLRRAPSPRPGAGGVVHPAPPAAGARRRRRRPKRSPRASASRRPTSASARIGRSSMARATDFIFAPLDSVDGAGARRSRRRPLGRRRRAGDLSATRAGGDGGRLSRPHVRLRLGHPRGPGDRLGRRRVRRRRHALRRRPTTANALWSIAQGVEMGRPSRIALSLEVERGALSAATIGGSAVLVGEGTIDL